MEPTTGPPGNGGSSGATPNPDGGRSWAAGTGTAAARLAPAREPRVPAPARTSDRRGRDADHGRPAGRGATRVLERHGADAGAESDRPSASFHSGPRPGDTAADDVVRQLIAQLAPLLGLDEARIAFGTAEAPGAPGGEASAERIQVAGDPRHPRFPAVVAHELAHVRQHANRGSVDADVTAAEAEAAGIAAAVAAGTELWVPCTALPSGRTARQGDATGIAPATKPADGSAQTTETATTPDVATLERYLDDYVAINHTGDVRAVTGLLDHPWTQNTSSMVEKALRVLSGFPFVVARAIVRALPRNDRRTLAQLGDDHHTAYPEACIAVLSALTAKELTGLTDTKPQVNGTPYPGAAAALRNVQPERLSPIARRALLATLRRAGKKTLAKLVDGERRDVFRALFASPPDAATDEAELRKALAAERELSSSIMTSDGLLEDRVEKLLRSGGRDPAKEALAALAPLCNVADPTKVAVEESAIGQPAGTPTLNDLRKAVAEAPKGGTGTNAPPATTPALIGLVNELDGKGLIGKLVETLDEDDRRHPGYGAVLKVVLAARSPASNLSRAVELLSYGIFDWAVRDYEARLAYLLVRSTPLDAQDSWRQLDNGKWFGRLLDNLPQDMWDSGQYTGVGSEYETDAALGVPETMLVGYAKGYLDLWKAQHSAFLAQWIVRNLLGRMFQGQDNPWIPGEPGKDLALRTAVIRRLDALQGLNEIIEKLPDALLLGEQTRQELLDLNQLRDPIHLVRQALGLMPGFFGLLTFTPHDAWIALQALRALSPAAQQAFATQNPSVWSTFWSGLTAEMRRSLPSTLATGRDDRLPTRGALRERLSDERLWTEANALPLRALVGLAIAADDRLWVFELTRHLRVDKRLDKAPSLAALLRDFGLFNEAEGRTVFEPTRTDSSHWPSGLRTLGMLVKGLVLGLYHLTVSDAQISLMGKTMHVKGFDLSQVQWARGGDIADGVTLASSPERPFGGAPAGTNHIDLDATFADGFIVNLDVPRVDIEGVNMVLPGKTYKTGPVSISRFRVSAGFSDRGYTKPGWVAAKFDALDLRDFVIVDPALPLSGAWAVANLGMSRLGFNTTPDAASDPSANFDRKLPEGTIPIPVFGPLFQLLANIVSLQGSIPGDYTLLDYAMIPLKLPFPVSTAASVAANKSIPTPAPLTYLWGLASDGVLRPPYSAARRIKDSTAMLRAFNVSFDKLEVKGISIGAGQQIGSLVLENVNVTVGQSLPAYLNAALAIVTKARLAAKAGTAQHTELVQREEALKKQLAAALGEKAADEKRLQELEGKDRWSPGSLSADQRAELVRLSKQLRSDVGVVAEIGSITLGPLSGAIQSPGVTFTGIHARAKLPNVGVLPYAPGYLDDKSLIDQFTAGGPAVPTIGQLAKSSEFSLVIDETKLTSTDPAQPAVFLKANAIPTVDALREELAALPVIEGNRPIRERLGKALDAVIALGAVQRRAKDAATETERFAAAQQVRELTDLAKRLLGTEVGGITFGRITGELDPQGTLSVSLHDIAATNIAGRGFAIDRAAGTASVGLAAGNIDARIDQTKGVTPGTLVTQLQPTFGLSGLEATGIHLPGGSIGRVGLGTLRGTLKTTPTGYSVPNLTVDRLEIGQVAMGSPGDGISAEAVAIDGLRMSIEVDVSRMPGGQTTVSAARIPSLAITRLGGTSIVMDSRDPDGSRTHVAVVRGAVHDIAGEDILFQPGSAGWELVKARVSVDRLEDVGFELAMGALSSRTSVAGTLTTASMRTSGKPTIRASYVRDDKGGRTVSLKVRDLLLLGTDVTTPDGSLTVRQVKVAADFDSNLEGARASATLTGLVVGPIRWRVGTATLSGTGPLTAASVTVAAVQTPEIPAKGKKAKVPAAWSVTDLVITKLTGAGLTWTDKPLVLSLGRSDKAGMGEPPLTVGRVHLKPAKKSFELSSLAVDVEGKLRDKLDVKGSLSADFISVDVLKGDKLHAVLRGISGSATLSGDYAGTASLSGLEGVAIDVGPDAITFGSDDPAESRGLFIEQISASALDIWTVVAGRRAHLFTKPPSGGIAGGRIDILGLRTRGRIEKRVPPVKGKSPFTKLAFDNFTIERIVLDGLQVDLPDDDVSIVIPPAATKGDETFMRALELTPPTGTDRSLLHPDFTVDLDTMKTEGTIGIAELGATVSANLKKKFSGEVRLTTGPSSLSLYAGGGMKVDVASPLVTMKKAADLGAGKSVQIGKLGAVRLVYTSADSHLYAEKPYISDLEYIQRIPGTTAKAVWIKAKQIDLRQFDAGFTKGMSVSIPSLDITDAYFSLNLLALMKKSASDADASASTFDSTSIRPAMDSLDGSISVEMYVSTDILGLKDVHIGTDKQPLVVPIMKGEIDIPTFEKNIKGMIHTKQIGEGWYLRPWVVNVVADDPLLAIHGNRVELGVYYVNPPTGVGRGNDPDEKNRPNSRAWKPILAWDLRRPDLSRAYANKFSLWSAVFDLHSDPPKTEEDLKKMSEEDRKKYESGKKAAQEMMASLELRRLDADVSMRNTVPIRVPISSDGAKGSIVLSKDALMNLRLRGGIPAGVQPAEREGTNLGRLDLGLDGFSLDSVDLTLYAYAPPEKKGDPNLTGTSALRTGKITIGALKDGALTFIDLDRPARLTGTITKAHAENISWSTY